MNASDLMQAKRTLSSRLLRATLRAKTPGFGPDIRVAAAIASAGQNVHAVGIGYKNVAGQPTKERCVRIYVTQKLGRSLLPPRDRLPSEIDGIPTDVIESPWAYFTAKSSEKTRSSKNPAIKAAAENCTDMRRNVVRPLVAGISAAHVNVTAGTLACFCRSTALGDEASDIFVLSNNHVLGDTNVARRGDEIYQPGPSDDGGPTDQIAEFWRMVDIRFGGDIANNVDAAIAKLISGKDYDIDICNIGSPTGSVAAIEDMLVVKHGRTTGLTEGRIVDVSCDQLVNMDHSDASVVARFENQIRIDAVNPLAFGKGGDSGSLVLEKETRRAVGLYFAGPSSGEYGLANPIGKVLEELNIELLLK